MEFENMENFFSHEAINFLSPIPWIDPLVPLYSELFWFPHYPLTLGQGFGPSQ
jgi:hypothetical protein